MSEPWKPRFNPWLIAIAVMSGTFMEVLDTSIANVALPHIAGSVSATSDEATWVITSYLVANAIVLPLTGWLGATFGRKRFLMWCIAIFTIASGITGAAQTLTQLIICRILQGMGGGALQPVSQAVLLESFPPQRRGAAMAFYGVGIVVAPILGPILGGWLTDNYSWRWSFYINIPVGILALTLIYIFIEDPPYLKNNAGGKVDFLGFAFLSLWVAALQIGLDKGQQEDWFASPLICWLAAIFVVFLVAFIVWELKVDKPVVDLRVLKEPSFALATVLITVVGAVLYGTLTLTPLFLQTLLGYPAFNAGLAVAPRGAGAMACMMLVGVLLARFDGRIMVGIGFVGLALSNFWLGHLNLQIGITDIAFPNILSGVATGLIFVPLTTIATARVPVQKLGQASGIYNLMRNVGGSVGIAISTTLLARGAQTHQSYLVEHVNSTSNAFANYQSVLAPALGADRTFGALYRIVMGQASMLSYVDTYRIMGVLCLMAVPLVFMLRKVPKGHKAGPGAAH